MTVFIDRQVTKSAPGSTRWLVAESAVVSGPAGYGSVILQYDRGVRQRYTTVRSRGTAALYYSKIAGYGSFILE